VLVIGMNHRVAMVWDMHKMITFNREPSIRNMIATLPESIPFNGQIHSRLCQGSIVSPNKFKDDADPHLQRNEGTEIGF